jgi:hypothetical protein
MVVWDDALNLTPGVVKHEPEFAPAAEVRLRQFMGRLFRTDAPDLPQMGDFYGADPADRLALLCRPYTG